MHPDVQSKIDELNEKVAKALEPYINRVHVTENTLHEIQHSLLGLLGPLDKYMAADPEHFKFVPDPADPSALIPGNLYTAMRLFYGPDSPTPAECEGNIYRHHDTTLFRWDPVTMQTTCVLPRPVNHIKVTLEVTRDPKPNTPPHEDISQ